MRLLASVLSIFLPLASAFAGETEWQNHQDMIMTRIVAASEDRGVDGKRLLGWEAKLQPGWKTYWRSPGEAGLPVRLYRDGTPLEIEFPLPHRFELFDLETYGYADEVTLPFYVKAGEVPLDITADFMVCKEICVPFQATYHVDEAMLKDNASLQDIRLGSWLKQVPRREGNAGAGLEIMSAKVMGTPGHQRVIVDAGADTDLSSADMLAEVEGMFHFGKPEKRLLEDGTKARFVLHGMTGKKPGDLRGRTIRLTFSDGHGHAIDRKVALPE